MRGVLVFVAALAAALTTSAAADTVRSPLLIIQTGVCDDGKPEYRWSYSIRPVFVSRDKQALPTRVRVRRGGSVETRAFDHDWLPGDSLPEYDVTISMTFCGTFPLMRLAFVAWDVEEEIQGYRIKGGGELDRSWVRITMQYQKNPWDGPFVVNLGPTIGFGTLPRVTTTLTDIATGNEVEERIVLPELGNLSSQQWLLQEPGEEK